MGEVIKLTSATSNCAIQKMGAAQSLRIRKLRFAFGLTFNQAALLAQLVFGEERA